jgi:O-antigen ligase
MLAVGGLTYFIFAPGKQRILLIVAGMFITVAAVFFLPQHLKDRFITLFRQSADTEEAQSAIESTEFRKQLLLRSLELSAEHPLFGVGPGMFMEADDLEAKAAGKERGYWHYSHNSYTELSSEIGLPGLIIFIMAIYSATKGLPAIRKRHPDRRIRETAMFLQIAMIMVSIGAFFLSIGYGGIVYLVMTIAAIFQFVVARQARLAKMQRA